MRGIIYLDKTSFDYYAEKMVTIPKLVFPAGTIQDIEVLDVLKLDQAIKTFVAANKLIPSSLTIVLSPGVVFMKDILKDDQKKVAPIDPKHPTTTPVVPAETKETQQEQIDAFLEKVPFNEVSSLTFPIQNGIKIIAANKELYTDIMRAFEKYGFTTDAVAPLIAFGASGQPVDQMIARKLLAHVDMARQHNMLTSHPVVQTKSAESETSKPGEKEKPSKTRLYIMVGAFVILMAVLGVMLYQTFVVPPPPPKKKPPTQSVVPTKSVITITPPITGGTSSSSALATFAKLTVQINTSDTTSSQSSAVEDALQSLGISDISVKKEKTTPSKTVIAYTKTLDPVIKEKIVEAFQSALPNALVTQAEDLSSDIVITLGKE